MKTTILARRIEFEGCVNFRDLGGYLVEPGGNLRWRQLFRSDSIHRMTASDARRARVDLGIKTIIDLRTEAETRLYGKGLLGLPPVDHRSVPLLNHKGLAEDWEGWSRSPRLSDCYTVLLAEAGAAIARVIRILGSPGALPAVFHCMAGKDRTGVVAAVILSLLGVCENDIVADYVLTEKYLGPAPVATPNADSGPASGQRQVPAALLTASPDTMRCFLKMAQEKFGSLQQFAMSHDVTAEEIRRVRAGVISQPSASEELTRI